MWLFAMFVLPTTTAQDKRRYVQFRKALVQDGFMMMQYSVYARYCGSEESAKVHRRRVRQALPPKGNVRLLAVTDAQFGKMENYIGRKREGNEPPPDQMLLL